MTAFTSLSFLSASPRLRVSRLRPVLFAAILAAWPGIARGQDLSESAAVEISRAYLASHSRTERQQLAARLATYDGDVSAVLEQLQSRAFPKVASGYFAAKHFSNPDLLARNPNDLLYFVVPRAYRPDRPTGLIVFLHGGGSTTTRLAPQATLNFPVAESPADTHRSGDMFDATGMIAVGPSAPWDTLTSYRW